MSYLIIEAVGKQYRVEKDAVIDIDLIDIGDDKTVKFDKVLLSADEDKIKIGQPYVKGASAEAEIVKNFRSRKVISYKYIRREGNAKTKRGHRQSMTRIKIKSVKTG